MAQKIQKTNVCRLLDALIKYVPLEVSDLI